MIAVGLLGAGRIGQVHAPNIAAHPGSRLAAVSDFVPEAAALEAGQIGKAELLSITSFDPAPPPLAYVKVSGGLFRDMMIHDFDMARSATPMGGSR